MHSVKNNFVEKMGAINKRSHQTNTRFLHHIRGWLENRAIKNPRNLDDAISVEVKSIVDKEYESDTGNDSFTGLPKHGQEKTSNG